MVDDLRFLDETSKVSTKHPATQRDQNNRITKPCATSLDSTGGDGIVWCFYHVTMETMTPMDHPYHLHAALPNMYYGCAQESALVLAARAMSYATGCRLRITKPTAARRAYATAIAALQYLLQDPSKASDDETLYAALLLCGYETTSCESENLEGWAVHVRGIATLLAHRSTASTRTLFGRRLDRFARRSVCLYQLQSGALLAPASSSTDILEHEMDNEADVFFGLMARLSDIRYRSRELKSLQCDVDALLGECCLLEKHFLNWRASLPLSWMYSPRCYLTKNGMTNPADTYTPLEVHDYPNIFVARIWNMYRTCLVILCLIKARLKDLQDCCTQEWYLTSGSAIARATVISLIDEICASVPFLTGKAEARQPPSSAWTSEKAPNTRSGTHHGKFSLLWPLHVCSARGLAPVSQRQWMREQIHMLAQSGEVPLASHVYRQECQIVSGGPEALFFDCV